MSAESMTLREMLDDAAVVDVQRFADWEGRGNGPLAETLRDIREHIPTGYHAALNIAIHRVEQFEALRTENARLRDALTQLYHARPSDNWAWAIVRDHFGLDGLPRPMKRGAAPQPTSAGIPCTGIAPDAPWAPKPNTTEKL